MNETSVKEFCHCDEENLQFGMFGILEISPEDSP